MDIVYLILLLLALVSFAVAAMRPRSTETVRRDLNLVALGLALWVAVPLLQHIVVLVD